MVDKIVAGTEPAPGVADARQAHDAAMAARAAAEGSVGQPAAAAPAAPAPEKPTRPDWVPEKFWNAEKGEVNVEAMAKSYATLEKSRTAPPATPPATPPVNPDGTPATPPAAAAPSRDEAVQLADREYAEKGQLSDDTYAKLEAAGYPRSQVDTYIAGQQAIANAQLAEVYGAAGGESEYRAMAEWAGTNLSAAEVEAFNNVLDSGNPAQIKLAVAGMASRYKAQASVEPTANLTGAAPGASAGDHYTSRHEMQADMSSPQYAKDPAFRAKVAAKVAGAAKAGINLFTY